MSAKRILTLTVGVAVLAALAAPMAFGSNMGFKLERPIDNIAESRSLYFVSLPFYRSFQDLAGDQSNPRTPNGVIDSSDVLLDWFTNGDGFCPGEAGDNGNNFPSECGGVITLFTFNADPAVNPGQTFTFQTIRTDLSGNPIFTSDGFTIQDPTDPNGTGETQQGYMAQAVSGQFPTITVGSHNPGLTEWVLTEFDPSRNLNIYSLPYHTTWTTSRELLTDVWDATETSKEIITLFGFDPDPATNPGQVFTTQTARADLGGNLIFAPDSGLDCGDGFCLTPGNGYMVQVVSGGDDGTVTVPQPHY
jgi:hypothetical protein